MKTEIASLAARIVELETRLAFQDNTIEELNEVVINQQQQFDRLEGDLIVLKRQLQQFVLRADEANCGHDY
jgi:SlyX protein